MEHGEIQNGDSEFDDKRDVLFLEIEEECVADFGDENNEEFGGWDLPEGEVPRALDHGLDIPICDDWVRERDDITVVLLIDHKTAADDDELDVFAERGFLCYLLLFLIALNE